MLLAPIGRRRCLQGAIVATGTALVGTRGKADPGAVEPVRELCDGLLRIMRAGQSTPFQQRFQMLTPDVDRAFDLTAVLQLSVGPSWSTLPSDQRNTLLNAFRRYTIANYVNNFDNYSGQRFEVEPDTKSLPNGEQLAQTKIIAASGESHELNYVMRRTSSGWKAVDVLADGSISRVAVQRSDFRRLVARGGAQALIESLNQKTSDLSGGALT
jgi:phospholipid transport system substrate-binding protein